MSKIFYDHLVNLKRVDVYIRQTVVSPEEKAELWGLVDEIMHQRILEVILDKLPQEFHQEFLGKLHQYPYDDQNITFLQEKVDGDIEEIIKSEVAALEEELLEEIDKLTR